MTERVFPFPSLPMKRWIFATLVVTGGLCLGAARSPAPLVVPVPAPADFDVSAGAKLSSTPPEEPLPACPPGMIEVEGEYCPAVEQYCMKQMDPKHPERDRCAEYAQTGRCLGVPVHKRVCVDRFEWPNRPGAKPDVGMDWNEANAQCSAVGKRLC